MIATFVVAAGAGLLVPVLLPTGLRRLPEPADATTYDKRPYRTLARPAFVWPVTAAVVLGVLGALVVPPEVRPLWWVAGGGGAVLAGIDAATTTIPRTWTWVTAGASAVVLVAGWALGASPGGLLRAALGAGLTGAFFVLFWWFGGMGFGDVRFVVLPAAMCAAISWKMLFAGLLAGTITALLVGLVARRKGVVEFPYAPGLWAGPYLAGLLALVGLF